MTTAGQTTAGVQVLCRGCNEPVYPHQQIEVEERHPLFVGPYCGLFCLLGVLLEHVAAQDARIATLEGDDT